MAKKKYKCDNCGYGFQSELEPRRCPYCSKENTVTLQMSDDEALTNIDDFLK